MRRLVLIVAFLMLGFSAHTAYATDRVDRLTNWQLKVEAQRVAGHGGILCQTPGQGAGCASWYMRRLTFELVDRAFPPYARAWAHCVAARESGGNPAALSTTGDHGVGQINYVSHPWIDRARIAHWGGHGWVSDVGYSVALFVRVSDHGLVRSPWAGGSYRC